MVLKCTHAELQNLLASYAKKEAVWLIPHVTTAALEQSYTEQDTWDGLDATVTKLAVQVTTSLEGRVSKVEYYLKRGGSPGGNVRARIYSDSSGLPDTVIADGTSGWVASSSIGTDFEWVLFSFSPEPYKDDSTIYHLSLEPDGSYSGGVSNYVGWGMKQLGSGGTGEWYLASSWANTVEVSPNFKLYNIPAHRVYLQGELSERTLVPMLDGDFSLYHVPIRLKVKVS